MPKDLWYMPIRESWIINSEQRHILNSLNSKWFGNKLKNKVTDSILFIINVFNFSNINRNKPDIKVKEIFNRRK